MKASKGMSKREKLLEHSEFVDETNKNTFVRSGVRTHALFRGPDLESGALDRSAILTLLKLQKTASETTRRHFDSSLCKYTIIEEIRPQCR